MLNLYEEQPNLHLLIYLESISMHAHLTMLHCHSPLLSDVTAGSVVDGKWNMSVLIIGWGGSLMILGPLWILTPIYNKNTQML